MEIHLHLPSPPARGDARSRSIRPRIPRENAFSSHHRLPSALGRRRRPTRQNEGKGNRTLQKRHESRGIGCRKKGSEYKDTFRAEWRALAVGEFDGEEKREGKDRASLMGEIQDVPIFDAWKNFHCVPQQFVFKQECLTKYMRLLIVSILVTLDSHFRVN